MITFVDASNNESNKSPSSEFVTVINGVTPVSLYHSETIPAGVTKKRLYRQNVVITNGLIVADDANWKLVSENSASATSATDTYADASIPGTALNAALRGLPPSPVGTPNTNAVLPDGGTPESRVYVYTLVSAYDEEGPPSDATAVVSCDPTKTVTLTVPVTPGGSYNLVKKRIYRSATGTAKTMFQFVGEVAAAVTTFADNVLTANLQELLKSAGWIPPPANLTGLRVMANGSAVGFAGNTVYLSEPNQPHAWPNIYPFDEDIIGIGTFGQSVAVLTKRYPYILQGVDPAAMTSTKLDLPQVCANKRSIVETGDGVLFASPDGLVMIGANTSIVTQNLIPRANWQAYNPASMECFLYNGRVIITYTNVSAVRGALILDLTGQGAVLTASDFNQTVATTAGFYSPERDTLYFVQNSQIVRFDAGITQMASVWRSKTFRMPAPVCLAFGQVRATTYPVTIKVYADGVLKTTKAVADAKQFRLPSGFKALDWEFQLEGSVEVNEVFLTTSTVELQNA